MTVYVLLAWLSLRKNMAYVWAHMATNLGSVLFGLIYMAFWRAAAHGRGLSMSSQHLVSYIAVSQVMLWVSTFLPADLGVGNQVRTGQISLEFVRPVRYLHRTLSAGAGEVGYNIVFRCIPLTLTFTAIGVMPWSSLQSAGRIMELMTAIGIAAMGGLLFQYLIGISAFWTTETRWSRRLYFALGTLFGGQIIPLALLPGTFRTLLGWLPFQALISFPALVWMHQDTAHNWISSVGWVIALFWICQGLTKRGQRRVEVQGG